MTRIDPEFESLCPPLTDQERADLEKDILARGCREPGVVWKEENLLLDGHHRRTICLANGRAFSTIACSFPSREAAKNWVIANALARRNLSKDQAAYLRGKLYAAAKKDPGETLRQNSSRGQSD